MIVRESPSYRGILIHSLDRRSPDATDEGELFYIIVNFFPPSGDIAGIRNTPGGECPRFRTCV
jgi:hypothetical protein